MDKAGPIGLAPWPSGAETAGTEGFPCGDVQ
jgi:hypothetical protein